MISERQRSASARRATPSEQSCVLQTLRAEVLQRRAYPSDVTDEEWELMVPLVPPGKSGGGKRTVIMREVVNGLMSVSYTHLTLPTNREV